MEFQSKSKTSSEIPRNSYCFPPKKDRFERGQREILHCGRVEPPYKLQPDAMNELCSLV